MSKTENTNTETKQQETTNSKLIFQPLIMMHLHV